MLVSPADARNRSWAFHIAERMEVKSARVLRFIPPMRQQFISAAGYADLLAGLRDLDARVLAQEVD